MSSPERRLYLTFAALSVLAIVLAALLARPGRAFGPVRGAAPFDFDDAPPPVTAPVAPRS